MRGRGKAGGEVRDRILATVEELRAELRRPPAPPEVALRLGMAGRTLRYHVRILSDAGRMERLHGGRALEVVTPAPQSNGRQP